MLEKTKNSSLLIAIITEETKEAALDIAIREGIKGSTIIPASGISQTPLRVFFGLTFQASMSIIFWIAETETANKTAKILNNELKLYSPQQGLAMTLGIDQLYGLNL